MIQPKEAYVFILSYVRTIVSDSRKQCFFSFLIIDRRYINTACKAKCDNRHNDDNGNDDDDNDIMRLGRVGLYEKFHQHLPINRAKNWEKNFLDAHM